MIAILVMPASVLAVTDIDVSNGTDETVSALGCDAYIQIDDPCCNGYCVYVDGAYKLTEGGSGNPDGFCAFYVCAGTHTIEITKNGRSASITKCFQSGSTYSWVSMPYCWCDYHHEPTPDHCQVYIEVQDPCCKGYCVYVDGTYILTEGASGNPDGYCAFYVSAGTHKFELRKGGYTTSKSGYCQCGTVYAWVSMPDYWCGDAHEHPADEGGTGDSDEDILLDVPFFSQRDPAWRDKKLDHSIYSLGKYGCALTSAAMVAKYFGYDTDPDKLNTRLTAVGGLDTSGIIHWKKVEDVSNGKVAWIESVGASWSRIDQELSSEYPVISSVNCPLGLHFIVFVGKSGDEHYFLDPYDKQRIIRIWPNGVHGVYTLINLKIYHGSPNTFVPSTLKVLIGTGSVVTMDLEEYVKGVVAAEMYPSWPIEALKAQAVASRTFAIANTHHDHINVDVCTDYHCCQAWMAGPYDENVEKAVTETHNEVLTYNGQIAKEALFFAHCNGHTRNSEDYCPGGNCWNYVSYLRSVACDCGYSDYSGSGVGMCQRGAKAMADQGYSYVDILKLYYTGIEVAASASASSPPNYFVSNQDKIEEAISWANNEIGNDEWTNLCLKFVSLAYGLGANVNAKTTGWDWPNDAINELGTKFYSIDNCGNPPRGALIFFSGQGRHPKTKINYEKYGHIGIYLGDGEVIHAYETVKIQNIIGAKGIEGEEFIDSYIGWAYPPEAWLDYPLPPTLVSPGSESPPGPTITTLTPTFEWNSVSTADYYGLYIRDLDMDEIVFNSRDDYGHIYGTSFPLPSGILDYGTHYRWNMNSYNSAGWGEFYSDRCWFTTYEK